MKPLSEVLRLSTEFLAGKGIARARRIAEELLAACLKLKRLDLYLQFERPISPDELLWLRDRLVRCGREEPVEYVTSEVDFYDCKISVDRRVLIPRPETEILVDQICKKMVGRDPKVCWDVCTGSGCIGIALKKKMPGLRVSLSDISQEALGLAASNAARNGVEVSLVLGNMLEPFTGQTADLFVCNPPYITTAEYAHLPKCVRDFEPQIALVGGDDGMDFYERLASALPSLLNPGASAFLEIGAGQGEMVKQIFKNGLWAAMELAKDWAGHDRFFFLEKQ